MHAVSAQCEGPKTAKEGNRTRLSTSLSPCLASPRWRWSQLSVLNDVNDRLTAATATAAAATTCAQTYSVQPPSLPPSLSSFLHPLSPPAPAMRLPCAQVLGCPASDSEARPRARAHAGIRADEWSDWRSGVRLLWRRAPLPVPPFLPYTDSVSKERPSESRLVLYCSGIGR